MITAPWIVHLILLTFKFQFQDDDDTDEVGEVFQDETNMAALLLYKQRLSDEYLMVSKHHCVMGNREVEDEIVGRRVGL